MEAHQGGRQRRARLELTSTPPAVAYHGLSNDSTNIYDHQGGAIVMASDVSQVPIPPQELLVPGSDDFRLREFNYNPQDKEVQLEAHSDYIICLAMHPALPLVFNGSDDMTIKS